MQKLFICGPFRASTKKQIKANIKVAEGAALSFWKKGYNVYCPHLNSGAFHGLVDDKQFLEAALQELTTSDIVVFLPGWRQSEGSVQEYLMARSLRKMLWAIDYAGIISSISEDLL